MPPNGCPSCDVNVARRDLLRAGATGAATLVLGQLFPGRVLQADEQIEAQVWQYPQLEIARLSKLAIDTPVFFNYPSGSDLTDAMLIRLGRRAGGGVGPDEDVVAFSAFCTHMGGSLADGYISNHKLLGCGDHLTTFDLTRHGQVAAGHASQALPQILLKLEDDLIYATGIAGLLYGYHDNSAAGG